MHRALRRLAPGTTLAVFALITFSLATGATSTATAADDARQAAHDQQARPTQPARPADVPTGFKAQSTTWLDTDRGFLLGAAPCGSDTCTYTVATTDAGQSWQTLGQVHSPIAQEGLPKHAGVTELRFTDATH